MEIIKKTRNKKEVSKPSITDAFETSLIDSNYILTPIEFSCISYKLYLFCNVTRTWPRPWLDNLPIPQCCPKRAKIVIS